MPLRARRTAAFQAGTIVDTDPNANPLPTPENAHASITIATQFDRVVSALRESMSPECFWMFVQATSSIVLRDDELELCCLHNPTAAAVTVTMSLDPGSQPIVGTTIAAGAIFSFTNSGLVVPRLSGFVSNGYIVLAGKLTR